jgi:hypothetical protein
MSQVATTAFARAFKQGMQEPLSSVVFPLPAAAPLPVTSPFTLPPTAESPAPVPATVHQTSTYPFMPAPTLVHRAPAPADAVTSRKTTVQPPSGDQEAPSGVPFHANPS